MINYRYGSCTNHCYCKFRNVRENFISQFFYFRVICEVLHSRMNIHIVFIAYSDSLIVITDLARQTIHKY